MMNMAFSQSKLYSLFSYEGVERIAKLMAEPETMKKEENSRWWWFEAHNTAKLSPWLRSTLSELNSKTKAMLRIIEEDADSFAQRAEMYYKRRPELITMVEELYRRHRSLAERFDQVRSENGNRVLTTLAFPFSLTKSHSEKVETAMDPDQAYDSYSEYFESEEYAESDIYDPELEVEVEVNHETQDLKDKEKYMEDDDEEGNEEDDGDILAMRKLREEIERLKEENTSQKEQLIQKDEEKREVIRQLSLNVQMLKDENVNLRKCVAKESTDKSNRFEVSKVKKGFFGRLFA